MESNQPDSSDSSVPPQVPVRPAPLSEEKTAPAAPTPTKPAPAVSSRKPQAPASSPVIVVATVVMLGLAALAVLAYLQSKR